MINMLKLLKSCCVSILFFSAMWSLRERTHVFDVPLSISEIPIFAMDLYRTYVSWQIICWKNNFEENFSFFKYRVRSQDDFWKKTSWTFCWYRGGSLVISLPAAYSTFLCMTDFVLEEMLLSNVKSKCGECEHDWCYNWQKNRFHSPNNHSNLL